jgi:hypothetical protein
MGRPIKTEVLVPPDVGPPLADVADWRKQARARRHDLFNDEKKLTYLREFRRTGIVHTAALAAGTTAGTVNKHQKLDAEFALAIEDVIAQRREAIVPIIEREFLEGHLEVIERGEGDKKTTITRKLVETAGRIAMLKKYDEGYRDRLQLETTQTGGGVIVIPMRLTEEEWDALYAPKEGGDLTDSAVPLLEGPNE